MYSLDVSYVLTDLTDVTRVDREIEELVGKSADFVEAEMTVRIIQFHFDDEWECDEAREKILKAGYGIFR